jgi:hypothetical protein
MEESAAPTWPPAPAAPTRPATPAPPTRLPAPTASIHAAGAAPTRSPADDFRYGPGVPAAPPAGQAGWAAEQVWRTGRPPEPPRRPRRLGRLRRLAGSALTVALLAASGVVLFLRFHHAPFQVTGVVISARTPVPCGDDVTGRITTDGAAGTVSYQWLLRPGTQPPQPGSQSVIAGQHAVYVIEPVEAVGHGKMSEKVTLQVTGPDRGSASTTVLLSC